MLFRLGCGFWRTCSEFVGCWFGSESEGVQQSPYFTPVVAPGVGSFSKAVKASTEEACNAPMPSCRRRDWKTTPHGSHPRVAPRTNQSLARVANQPPLQGPKVYHLFLFS